MSHLTLYLHMIPVVGLQQMGLIGIFLQDRRTLRSILHTRLIAIIPTETGRRIVITAIAEVIHLQRVTPHEDATPPRSPRPEILGMRV